MKDIIFKGCGTAICTPFSENGEINYKVFEKFIEFQIENKIDAIIVCGTTGESSTMTEQERKDVIKFVVDKVNKRIPVIAGTGSNNTLSAVEMTKFAESVGADGALVVTPYYNKTTQDGVIKHYEKIAQNTNLPIILYNVPSRTGFNIEPETCLKLSKIKNIVAIKEASGNISQVAKISALCKDELQIYSGNDDQILPVMSLGGIGVISVLSNIYPQYTHNMIEEFFEGNISQSTNMQLNSLDVIEKLFIEVNPVPVKAALKEIGFDFGAPRLPLIKISTENKIKIQLAMRKFNAQNTWFLP